MRVEPEMLDHPKFLRLEKRVGEAAAKFLLRIWGHCQGSQRGGSWPNADAEYVEVVCRWAGEQGVLFKALVETGWIDKLANRIVIHDWDKFNSKAKANWKNGHLGGRPRVNPPETHQKPTDNPPTTPGKDGKPSANLRVSESVSESVSSTERESGKSSPVEVSKLRWASMRLRIKELEGKPVGERTPEERVELVSLRKRLRKHEQDQREGRFE